MKGVPFLLRMVYKRIRVSTSRRNLPVNFLGALPAPLPPPHPPGLLPSTDQFVIQGVVTKPSFPRENGCRRLHQGRLVKSFYNLFPLYQSLPKIKIKRLGDY